MSKDNLATEIKILDYNKVEYKDLPQEYILIEQDWGYDEIGKFCPSWWWYIKHFKNKTNISDYIAPHFKETIIEKAIKLAKEKGLYKIRFTYSWDDGNNGFFEKSGADWNFDIIDVKPLCALS